MDSKLSHAQKNGVHSQEKPPKGVADGGNWGGKVDLTTKH